MPYAAAIKADEEHVLQEFAPCFVSAIARIRRRAGEWILESSSFEAFEFGKENAKFAKSMPSCPAIPATVPVKSFAKFKKSVPCLPS